MGQPRWVTNTNENFSTEKAGFEVLDVCYFPFPEKTGKVVCFENNFVCPDVLMNAVIYLSVSESVGNSSEKSREIVPVIRRRAE